MIKKPVLLMVLVALCCSAIAQPPLQLGQAVTTNSCFSSNEQAVKIFDVRNPASATLGENWGLGNNSYPNWTAQNLGQVFGLAIDPINPDHIIYVSTTQIYQQHNNYTYASGYQPFPNATPTNTPLIWRLNAATGSAAPLIRSQTSPAFSTTKIFNRGTGMGNICYDKTRNLMYATNMEDGRIYCINPLTNTVISRYDPFGSFTLSSGNNPDFAPLGQRLWGIGVSGSKVYFAVWREDYGHQSAMDANAIYSVDIDAAGQFVPTGSGGHTGNDYYDPTPNHEFDIPMIRFDHAAYSPPVADIEFSLDGTQMWLAERTMSDATPGYNIGNFQGWAHDSRVLRYDLSGPTWVASSIVYHIGNSGSSTNATGGVDLGYAVLDPNGTDVCESIVYATGDALKFDNGAAYGVDKYIYGFTGVPLTGNNGFNPSGMDPNAVNVSSIYQDMFGNNTAQPHSKSQPGDIDIYREACNCYAETPQVAVDTNQPAELPVFCVGDTATVFFKTNTTYARYFIEAANGTHYQSAVFTTPAGSWFPVEVPLPTGANIGVNHVCLAVYSADPGVTNEWCSASACYDINVRNCKCDTMVVEARLDVSTDTVCVGQEVTFTIHGPGWGKLWFDDPEESDGYFEIPAGGITQVGIPPVNAIGSHHLCLILFTANPYETNEWCSDTICKELEVVNCGCDSLLGNASLAKSKLGPMQYEFWDALADDMEPAFINWYIDGDQKAQTPGDGTFDWTFTPGMYQICMQVAYILPGQNGSNECCYDWVCDTLYVDSCDYWKANNGLTITPDPFNYRDVTFTYTQDFGANSHVPTVIFEFGDGQTQVTDGSTPLTHHYQYTGSMNYCVYVIWSLHDQQWSPDTPSVCCCVDTICGRLNINPCLADTFGISFVTDPNDGTTHLHADNYGSGVPSLYEWTVDGTLQGTTASPDMNYGGDGKMHHVCLKVTYFVSPPNEGTFKCEREICVDMVLDGPSNQRTGFIVRYFPNPANTSVNVEVSAKAGDKCIIEMVDYLGRPMLMRKFEGLHDGSNMLYMNISAINQGLYSMKVTVAENSSVVKLLKK